MKDIIQFLNQNKFGNLATCSQDKPDTRPFEFVFHSDKGMFFYTSTGEDVEKQLKSNANICFCATDSNYNYVKVSGSALFSHEEQDKVKILENSKFAKTVFHDSNLDTMVVFYLPHGTGMMHFHGDNRLVTAEF